MSLIFAPKLWKIISLNFYAKITKIEKQLIKGLR